MLERLEFKTREEWLAGRGRGLGGSDAAAVLGLSPWTTPMKLWKQKIGAEPSMDLSGSEAVSRGVRMEPAIRAMFEAEHPEMEIGYHQFDILFQAERPWLFATLDGELVINGERGILEVKTASLKGSADWAKWKGAVPQNYFVQVLHQMLATGYSFAYLYAALIGYSGDITLREYQFQREDCEEDLRFLLEQEARFWKHCEDGTLPSTVLAL